MQRLMYRISGNRVRAWLEHWAGDQFEEFSLEAWDKEVKPVLSKFLVLYKMTDD
jgi:hypothetical protein